MANKGLSQLGYSQEAGSQLPSEKPESLLLAKYIEVGPCDLTIKDIHNTCQEKTGWLSKIVNNQ